MKNQTQFKYDTSPICSFSTLEDIDMEKTVNVIQNKLKPYITGDGKSYRLNTVTIVDILTDIIKCVLQNDNCRLYYFSIDKIIYYSKIDGSSLTCDRCAQKFITMDSYMRHSALIGDCRSGPFR